MSTSFTDLHPEDPDTAITYNFNSGLNVPTTMSWAGHSRTSLVEDMAPTHILQLSADSGDAMADPPPDYAHLFIPTHSLTYTFLMTDDDAMLLIPPSDAPDTRPVYHISVSVNPFMPSISTTTIRKAAADGDWVGSLEWGPNHLTPLLSIGSVSRVPSAVLTKVSRGTSEYDYKWDWNGGQDHKMYWVCNRHLLKCYLQKDSGRPNVGKDTPIAEFSGRNTISTSARRRERPPITLKVHPDGHIGPRLIYIVIAALMIERRRD